MATVDNLPVAIRALWSKLLALFRREGMARELAEEAEAHFEMEVEANLERGMSEAEAREEASRHFGNRTQIREASREAWLFAPIEDLFHDLRYGCRNLRRSPVFTAVALLTLALGIGGNTVIFSAINGILMEHLPYARASQLLVVGRKQSAWGITRDEARVIGEHCPACESTALANEFHSTIAVGDSLPQRRWITRVSGGFFPLLGVSPAIGRYILPSEEQAGSRVAVLSYHLWRDLFAGDPNVLGREDAVDDARYSIVGVMPEKFELGINLWTEKDEGLWIPILNEGPRQRFSLLIARARDGVSATIARDQIQGASSAVVSRFPAGAKDTDLKAETPKRQIDRDVRTGLLILQAVVAFVLLLASVNVSSLLVARSWSRQRELAVRRALGASRSRIFRQLLSESLLLAMGGGALGLLFSIWGIRILRALAPPGTPRLDRMQLDANVLCFTLAVSVFAALLFGVMPAIQASANRAIHGMRDGLSLAVASVTHRRRTLRNVLLIVEVGLATVVVVGAALLTHSFANLMGLNPGVRADHTLSMRVELSETVCTPSCEPAVQTILDRARTLPGIDTAATSYGGPLSGGISWRSGILLDGAAAERPFAGSQRIVSPGFFQTAGMQIVRGRDFVEADSENATIVTQQFARAYFPENPLGKRFSTHKDQSGRQVWLDVVGVVNDTRDRALRQFGSPEIYYTRSSSLGSNWQLLARTSSDPGPLVQPLQNVLRRVDKNAIVTDVQTLEQALSKSAALPRFQTSIFGAFGVLALGLAMIGIFGVTSYSVQQRTREIGIRMALGARVGQVMCGMIAQGATLALGGIVCGLAVAVALARFVESMLFGVPSVDPVTYSAAAALLLSAALFAFYLPARAAARVDPVQALRHE